MLRYILPFASAALPACHSYTPASAPDSLGSEADSVVLIRTQSAFRIGPAYRVRVARDGGIHFESRLPSDSGRVATSRIDSVEARTLLQHALRLGLDSLPDDVIGKAPYCRPVRTDASTAIIELYGPDLNERFRDYLGCTETHDESPGQTVRRLRAFEAAVDNTVHIATFTGSGR